MTSRQPWDQSWDQSWEWAGSLAGEELPAGGAILLAAGQQARRARAALSGGDHETATAEGHELLGQVEDLLERFSSPDERDRSLWTAAVGLRDELGGYLLAARTLEETGVSAEVVVNVLRRAAACAEDALDGLAARAVERQSA
jgi:hypothetical protein